MKCPRTSRYRRFPQSLTEVADLASRLGRAIERPASKERLATLLTLSYERVLAPLEFLGETSSAAANSADDAVRALAFIVSGARGSEHCQEAAKLFAFSARKITEQVESSRGNSQNELTSVASCV